MDIISELNNKYHDEKWKWIINTKNNTKTKYIVSTKGRIYNIKKDVFVEEKIIKSINRKNKKGKIYNYNCKPRIHVRLNDGSSDFHFAGSPARIEMMTFKPLKSYDGMEVDHVDGNPLNNNIDNLEWVVHHENMKRAIHKYMNKFIRKEKQIGGFCPRYTDKFIHKICKDICKGLNRQELMVKYSVNGQLIDDLKSGRSHKDVTSLYIDKGFQYNIRTEEEKIEKRKQVKNICRLIDDGFTNNEIIEIMNLPQNEVCLPNDIRKHRVYRYIAKDYNFGKGITQKEFKERI